MSLNVLNRRQPPDSSSVEAGCRSDTVLRPHNPATRCSRCSEELHKAASSSELHISREFDATLIHGDFAPQLVAVLHNSEVTQVARRYVANQRASGTLVGWAIGRLGDELLSRSPDELAAEVAAAAQKDLLAGAGGADQGGSSNLADSGSPSPGSAVAGNTGTGTASTAPPASAKPPP